MWLIDSGSKPEREVEIEKWKNEKDQAPLFDEVRTNQALLKKSESTKRTLRGALKSTEHYLLFPASLDSLPRIKERRKTNLRNGLSNFNFKFPHASPEQLPR